MYTSNPRYPNDIPSRSQPQMLTYLTCHPRHIKERASQLAGTILENKKRGLHHAPEYVAKALYKSAVTMPQFCRSATLIARSTVEELFWTDEQGSSALQEDLADLVTSNFVVAWTKEFNRGTSADYEILAAQAEDNMFKQSNPRPEEPTFEDLYSDEMDITNYQISDDIEQKAQMRAEADRTPKQQKIALPPIIDTDACCEEELRMASILLGDLYAMGFIHAEVMKTCILYLIDNSCHSIDLSCLHAVLDRAATYLAPKLGSAFLRTCRYKVALSGATRLQDKTDTVVNLLTLIDDIIDHDLAGITGFPVGNVKYATHHIRSVGRGIEVESYHPASTFETFGEGINHPLQRRDTGTQNVTLEESSVAFVQQHLDLDPSSITFKSGFSGEVARHAYVKQTHNGIPFANAVANVAFNHDDKVVAFGSSFVKPKSIAPSTPSIALSLAISNAEDSLVGTYNGWPTSLQYLAKSDGSAALTHAIQIQNETAITFYEAFIDAHSGELLHITDFVAQASYRVLPITKEVLTQGFETVVDPQDPLASPNGWHTAGGTVYSSTRGNNAMAYQGGVTSLTAASSATLNFIYNQDSTLAPSSAQNVDASRTNAFYVVNTMHDIFYRSSFCDVVKSAYNFQSDNFGKGGVGNDYVTVAVQSGAGLDNANFVTPPDGQFGQMHMFLWDYTSPERDGALENDIVTHENTHGLTNRMTGGGTGACLQTLESGGLGEGWSDAMADWVEHNSSALPDYVLGPYVIDFPTGIRGYPYSTNNKTNPLRYSSLNSYREVHAIGEIWANMLHNVYAALVTEHGWSSTARTDPTGTQGNVVFLHLFIDALPLQPCNPTFLNARDAWLQADVNRYGGANKCLLWKTFASRGMGVNAADYEDSSAVPAGC
ncbi:hypothetical protein DXG01_006474 [Tephrocybe rancida]|nr:hypothetical protein DXG01_006474 [Tephrocybe rancida]